MCALLVWCGTGSSGLCAQTFKSLFSFQGAGGSSPSAGLIQATDGNLYGTTFYDGANCAPYGCGTIFKITTDGKLTTVYSFCAQSVCPDGQNPTGLIQATDGNFYGTCGHGGTVGVGTVFKMTPAGTLSTLYNFCSLLGCPDGENPYAGIIQGYDGDFYGTTYYGGAAFGTVFKITPGGVLTTLYAFSSGTPAGVLPDEGLVQAPNGDFYGATLWGGENVGTIFRITSTGEITTLHTFCAISGCLDGAQPSTLVFAPDGNLYGTTYRDGAYGAGTVFKITPKGTLTTLHSFCAKTGCPDGGSPNAALAIGASGDFYGTTSAGGARGGGTIFKFTFGGALTTLYNFCSAKLCADGEDPIEPLLESTNGSFYGTTQEGGSSNKGSIFALLDGIAPFVKTLPHAGKVGAVIGILGTDLTGVTSVSFNGSAAAFSIVSPSQIMAAVPAGAATGRIEVTTPAGKLFSAGPFLVVQ